MFLEAIILSAIIGFIRGGNLRGFKRLNKLSAFLFIVGAVIQYLLGTLDQLVESNSIDLIMKYNKPIQILSYAFILTGIFTNIKFKSLWVVLIGYIFNFLSVAFNDWVMPNLFSEEVESAKLAMLGKTIQFVEPYPFPKLLSLGDLIIAFGIFSLIQEIMLEGDGSTYSFKF
jgi:hypothetical protein